MSFICIVCRDILSNNPPLDDGPVQGAAAALPVPPNNDIVATKCGHLYHLSCFRGWFNKQVNPRRECALCKTNVKTDDYQRIYPIGDEESEDIETRLKNAKEVQKELVILKDERARAQLVWIKTQKVLMETHVAMETLQHDFHEQSKELLSLQQMLQTIDKSHKELIDKVEKHKTKLEKMLEESEMKLIARQVEMEQRNHTAHNHSSDSANMIRDLTTSHELLRNEIRALQEQLKTPNEVSPPKRTRVVPSVTHAEERAADVPVVDAQTGAAAEAIDENVIDKAEEQSASDGEGSLTDAGASHSEGAHHFGSKPPHLTHHQADELKKKKRVGTASHKVAKKTPNKKTWPCNDCTRIFTTRRSRNHHKESHGVLPKCKYENCLEKPKTFSRKDKYRTHVKTFHPKIWEEKFLAVSKAIERPKIRVQQRRRNV